MTARFGRVLRTRTAMASWVVLWVVAGAVLVACGSTGRDRPVPASIRVLRMTAGETVVEVTVLGRDLVRVVDTGPATLTDSAGSEHLVREASIAGRTFTVGFDGSASVAPGRARVDFPRVALTKDLIEAVPGDEHVTYVTLELLFDLAPTGGGAQAAGPNGSGGMPAVTALRSEWQGLTRASW